jgi:hypothetical protein
MNGSFSRFGGLSAMIVGVFSILYAVFYLVIARQAAYVGALGSWLILGASGIFSSAAFVALYQRVRSADEGFSLWALLLGVLASFSTLVHGIYEALLMVNTGTAQQVASEVDPAGLATFAVTGLAALVFGWLIVRSGLLPRRLGQLGMVNAVLLVVLFLASFSGAQTLILISGGLTSLLAGPIWWIWLGSELRKQAAAREMTAAHAM